MAEQNKDTQNTSFDADNQSTNLTDTNLSDTSDFGANDTATTDFGGGEFGNAGTVNADFSDTGSVTGTSGSSTNLSGTSGTTAGGNQTGSTDLSVDSVKETARGLYDQAKSTAGQAFGAATKRATEALDEKKGTVASGLTSVADSIKQVGENLNTTEEANPITETAAKYTNNIAQQIENLSGYFERKDVREMVRDVEVFARRYPAYFIGGAVALGFLAARFLKSSNPRQLSQAAGQTFPGGYNTGKSLTTDETTPGASQF
ncbi:MAG TPA: hypothetical protein VGC97_13660 [Pyrinomonadaceae bacterium]|jgi:hypothetical protein